MNDYNPSVEPGSRVVIVGGPMAGKSTLARQLRDAGFPTFCTDPRSTARSPEPDVTYMPEVASWAGASDYAVRHWFSRPGPWVIEGHATARALRKQLRSGPVTVDRVLLLRDPYPTVSLSDGQLALTRSVLSVWNEIADQVIRDITQELTAEEPMWPVSDWSPMSEVRSLASQIDEAFRRR